MTTDISPAESDTLDAVSSGRQTSAPSRGYGSLWRRVPRELGFLVLTMPVAIVGLGVLQPLFWAGVGTLIIWIGFFLVLAALYAARGFGTLQLIRLRWAGRPEITRPQWARATSPSGFVRRTFGTLSNGHYWLYLLHTLFINPVVAIFTWTVTIVWISVSLGGLTYWFWDGFIQRQGEDFVLSKAVFGFLYPGTGSPFDGRTGDNILMFAAGVIALVTLPFITRGLVVLNDVIARGLLGAWRSEALQREVADLDASRGAAVAAEDVSLRRLERDIHDGPQQRLLRLQMDLAAAERRLAAGETDAASDLLAQARTQSGETLEELRALSRGIAPPILQDRGLNAALESLAARSTLPVGFENDLAGSPALPGEVERSAYFVASELLTNVARHSGASRATLKVAWSTAPDGQVTLSVWVTDNGHGGAALRPEHGLSGLVERLRGLRGTLTIDSPAGGPTTVGAHIPVENAAGRGPVS